MKKMTFCLLLFVLSILPSFAQNNEPANNIGKSLSLMKQQFPELRYIETDSKGDKYEDGYPQDGIAVFFYLKDNLVIEECMIIQSNDDFPRMWFDKMVDEFISNYSPGFGVSNYNSQHWCYSTFQVHLIYVSENRKNTALIVYEKGGYETGITGKDFFEMYNSK